MTNTQTKVTAVAAMHGQAYTDCQVAKVRGEVLRLRQETIRDAQRVMRMKITVHVTVFALGIALAYVVSPILLPFITGVPAIVIEGVDRFLRL